MKKIISLANQINLNKLQWIEVLGNPLPSKFRLPSTYERLYDAIVQGEIIDDKTAAAFLGYTVEDRGYKRAKRELTKRLHFHTYFLDPKHKEYNARRSAVFAGGGEFARILILLNEGQRDFVIDDIIKLHERFAKYQISNLAMNSAKTIKEHFLYHQPDKNNYWKYRRKYEHWKKNYLAYIRISNLYHQFVLNYQFRISIDNNEIQHLRHILHEAELIKVNTYLFLNHYYILRINLNTILGQKDKAIEIAEKAILTIENQKRFKPTYILNIIKMELLPLLIETKHLRRASELLRNNEFLGGKTSNGWLRGKISLFLALQDYTQAVNTYQNIILNNKGDNWLLETENWKMLNAWLYLIHASGKTGNMIVRIKQLNNFKINRFLNNFPMRYKDKAGANAQVHIIEILYHIVHHRSEELLDTIEAYEKYYNRYLKKTESRTSYFFRMLIYAVKYKNNLNKYKKYEQKYLLLLKEHPLEKSQQHTGLEIIRYEQLWEIIKRR